MNGDSVRQSARAMSMLVEGYRLRSVDDCCLKRIK